MALFYQWQAQAIEGYWIAGIDVYEQTNPGSAILTVVPQDQNTQDVSPFD